MRTHTISPVPGVDLNALCAEARRRGLSYGQLVARTDAYEQERIIKRYIEDKKAAEREARERRKAEEQAQKEKAKGGRRPPFDKTKARELYDLGMQDGAIAAAMKCSKATVCNWRNAEGLLPHGQPPRIDEAKAMQLYEKKLSDGQMAERLGVTSESVRKWRTRRGLPSNYAKGEKTNVKYAKS